MKPLYTNPMQIVDDLAVPDSFIPDPESNRLPRHPQAIADRWCVWWLASAFGFTPSEIAQDISPPHSPPSHPAIYYALHRIAIPARPSNSPIRFIAIPYPTNHPPDISVPDLSHVDLPTRAVLLEWICSEDPAAVPRLHLAEWLKGETEEKLGPGIAVSWRGIGGVETTGVIDRIRHGTIYATQDLGDSVTFPKKYILSNSWPYLRTSYKIKRLYA